MGGKDSPHPAERCTDSQAARCNRCSERRSWPSVPVQVSRERLHRGWCCFSPVKWRWKADEHHSYRLREWTIPRESSSESPSSQGQWWHPWRWPRWTLWRRRSQRRETWELHRGTEASMTWRCWTLLIARAAGPRVWQRSSQSRRCEQRSGPNAFLPREELIQRLHGRRSAGSDNLCVTEFHGAKGYRVDWAMRERWKRKGRSRKHEVRLVDRIIHHHNKLEPAPDSRKPFMFLYRRSHPPTPHPKGRSTLSFSASSSPSRAGSLQAGEKSRRRQVS